MTLIRAKSSPGPEVEEQVVSGPVVCWGEVLWDQYPDGARLGGAPSNVAWHLGQLAVPVALASAVGADPLGLAAIAALAPWVATDLVRTSTRHRTGEVTITIDAAGEPRYRLIADRAWEHLTCDEPCAAAIAVAPALVWGTLALRTPSGLAAWREARAHLGATAIGVCDPNLRPGHTDPAVLDAAISAATWIKLGDAEVTACGHLLGWADPIATLRARGHHLAITHGARGATLYVGAEVHVIEAFTATAGGDNVGCGDGFVAGLCAGLVRGLAPATAGRLGAAVACEVASVRGATPVLTEASLQRIWQRVGVPRPKAQPEPRR